MADDVEVGVGPHAHPWPEGEQYDPVLLEQGDRRNVLDEYRYWSTQSIVDDLDTRRHSFHVAIENWQHDFNIGAIVRNANAFLAHTVHIIGKKRWNRRGAMVTDKYQHIEYHSSIADFRAWAVDASLDIVGIDIVDGSAPLEAGALPQRCVLVFGQEGPGLSSEMLEMCTSVRAITQYGSTRSINVGVASGVAMYAWCVEHAT